MEKRSVLVTGGMGFVGANIALRFLEEGYEPILYDISGKEIDFLGEKKANWKFVQGDVEDWRRLVETVETYGVEGIIHCALPINPGSREMAKSNWDACHQLLEVCRLRRIKFVFISSNAAYGYRPDPNPLRETDFAPILTGSPLDEYGAMKQMCEALTTMYHAVHGVDSVSCRISWVFGPGTHRGWYPQWFLSHALAGTPAKLERGGDHEADYTFVRDVAQGVYRAFTIRPLRHRLYNLTGGRKISAQEVVATVKRIVPGAQIEVGPGQMEKGLGNPAQHPLQVGTISIERAQEDLGYHPTPFEEALRQTAEWYRKQPKIVTTPWPAELRTRESAERG
jgi:UDP-glucose 4-epimerase